MFGSHCFYSWWNSWIIPYFFQKTSSTSLFVNSLARVAFHVKQLPLMRWWQNPKFVTIRKCSVSGTLLILIFKFHGISRMSPHFHDCIANKVMDHPTECDGKLKFWSNSSLILHNFENEMDSKNVLCWLVDCHPQGRIFRKIWLPSFT